MKDVQEETTKYKQGTEHRRNKVINKESIAGSSSSEKISYLVNKGILIRSLITEFKEFRNDFKS